MDRVSLSLCPGSCNRRGTCQLLEKVYSCVCRSRFAGKACEFVKSVVEETTAAVPAPEESSFFWFMFWTLIVFLLAGLAILGYYWVTSDSPNAAALRESLPFSTDPSGISKN